MAYLSQFVRDCRDDPYPETDFKAFWVIVQHTRKLERNINTLSQYKYFNIFVTFTWCKHFSAKRLHFACAIFLKYNPTFPKNLIVFWHRECYYCPPPWSHFVCLSWCLIKAVWPGGMTQLKSICLIFFVWQNKEVLVLCHKAICLSAVKQLISSQFPPD